VEVVVARGDAGDRFLRVVALDEHVLDAGLLARREQLLPVDHPGADVAHLLRRGAAGILGVQEVEAAGGKVLALPLEPGYSTTGMVQEILARRG